ncbi:MAG: hypothetical protein A3C38_06105 [Planctomycetes bacterium RIFCSPHIGHO2_02_FULL_50_42]|nr:MAG: hypothetical protein A2060_04920 [Planctomycetes bacterium GWA2_50_13]OHB89642.1 MAG: hypothetical protein A3C38_06105 [Planctomycetes bacterium RIFCSPHIGHO2_02_FULL_50_42]OHB92479.1 MAG: hypothetical protein A3E75_03315 [Planctomycetes bacterium RIFCSPHIGHO2_12_FULL_51_37]OHB94827.1 MAG: hypothetical protein A3I59_01775 [Planctomycetes bacterium RIFCSPLOWO2_02_FULL_50_16]OHC02627.1 MAG: hypothetical protein A3G17_09410 [Planctomycetes bacterium RIFCSPLOWO2_12_FULL_50_35]
MELLRDLKRTVAAGNFDGQVLKIAWDLVQQRYPHGDLNPGLQAENLASWAARRLGAKALLSLSTGGLW